jgi:hypothetical protein
VHLLSVLRTSRLKIDQHQISGFQKCLHASLKFKISSFKRFEYASLPCLLAPGQHPVRLVPVTACLHHECVGCISIHSITCMVVMQTLQRSTFDVISGVSAEENTLAFCAVADVPITDVVLAEWQNTTYRCRSTPFECHAAFVFWDIHVGPWSNIPVHLSACVRMHVTDHFPGTRTSQTSHAGVLKTQPQHAH